MAVSVRALRVLGATGGFGSHQSVTDVALATRKQGDVMSYLDSREQLSEDAVTFHRGRCLIFSASSARREMLAHAAATAGWNTVICEDPEAALVATRRASLALELQVLVPRAGRRRS